jgi:chemotaxis protein MotB
MNDGTPIIIKRKKAAGHGHHGGAWKVAYADFVTAMMAFFMTLWIIGMASEQDKKLIAAWFRDPAGFEKSIAYSGVSMVDMGPPRKPEVAGGEGGQGRIGLEEQEMRRIEEEVKERVEAAGDATLEELMKSVRFEVTEEGLQIEFLESSGVVFFELGSATIRPQARKLIRRIAPLLAQSGRRLIVDGHTDARPFPGAAFDNWDLSSARAASMRRALKAGGVGHGQFLAVRGFADTRPRTEDPFDPTNRRVSVLLPFKTAEEAIAGLPLDALKGRIQGAFRRPVEVAPDPPDLKGGPP